MCTDMSALFAVFDLCVFDMMCTECVVNLCDARSCRVAVCDMMCTECVINSHCMPVRYDVHSCCVCTLAVCAHIVCLCDMMCTLAVCALLPCVTTHVHKVRG